MKLRFLSIWLLAMSGLIFGVLPGTLKADLATEVEAILQDKLLRKTIAGVEVYRLGTIDADATEILNIRGQTPFTPASNLKVVTTSAALDQLGPGFRFRTLLHPARRRPDNHRRRRPRPSATPSTSKRPGGRRTTVFENWAAQLKKLNIASVSDIIVDDSIFDENFPTRSGRHRDAIYLAFRSRSGGDESQRQLR